MDVRKYKRDDAGWWDEFVYDSINGTIFNTRRFLSYHPEDRFNDHSLYFFKKNKVFCVLPGIEKSVNGKKMFVSHQGASYGGFIHKGCSIKDAYDLVKSFIEYIKDNDFKNILITNAPKIYYSKISDYIDFALVKHGFVYKRKEISSYLELPENFDLAFSQFSPPTRTSVRKSEKSGVYVKESDDYETFYFILKRNLKLRHNVKPTHTLEEIKLLKTLFPEQIKLFGAYYKDIIIGGIVMFRCNSLVNLAFYISGNLDYQELRPVDILMSEVIKHSIKNNFKYLDFGLFTVNMKPNFGLARFKEKFGATGVFRNSFELSI